MLAAIEKKTKRQSEQLYRERKSGKGDSPKSSKE
jgi:hypothetical protein